MYMITSDLSNDKESGVRMHVAENKNTSTETLTKLSNDENKFVREYVAENSNTPIETIEKLSNDEYTFVRERVARNPNLSTKTLDKLATDKQWEVRSTVAANKNTSQDAIKKLIKTVTTNMNAHTAIGLSVNPNLSSENIDELYSKSYGHPLYDNEIRRNLANHKNTSTEILRKLMDDNDEETSKAAKENLAKRQKEIKFDITKLSPELREKVKDWDAEDIAKFIGWLKKQKEEAEA